MAIQIQLRQGTTTEHSTFTGAVGEVTVDTTNKTLRVHDGVTAGGTPLLNASQLVDSTSTVKGVTRFATATEVANKSNVSAAVTPSNASTIAQSTDLGVGQTWQDVTSGRFSGVTYTNNTGKPITVIVSIRDANIFSGVLVYVGGVVIINVDDVGAQGTTPYTFIVPSDTSYLVNVNSNTIRQWSELR